VQRRMITFFCIFYHQKALRFRVYVYVISVSSNVISNHISRFTLLHNIFATDLMFAWRRFC